MKRRAFLKTALLSLVAAYSPISLKSEERARVEELEGATVDLVCSDEELTMEKFDELLKRCYSEPVRKALTHSHVHFAQLDSHVGQVRISIARNLTCRNPR